MTVATKRVKTTKPKETQTEKPTDASTVVETVEKTGAKVGLFLSAKWEAPYLINPKYDMVFAPPPMRGNVSTRRSLMASYFARLMENVNAHNMSVQVYISSGDAPDVKEALEAFASENGWDIYDQESDPEDETVSFVKRGSGYLAFR
jgi:hypothetical protein